MGRQIYHVYPSLKCVSYYKGINCINHFLICIYVVVQSEQPKLVQFRLDQIKWGQ